MLKKMMLTVFVLTFLSTVISATTYHYNRSTLNTPIDGLIYPFVNENPDGDLHNSTYYGEPGQFYYNNASSEYNFTSGCGFSTKLEDIPYETKHCNSQPPGLVSYWTFDNKNATDMIGGNNGTYHGETLNDGTLGGSTSTESSDPTWVYGKHGQALDFDGSDDAPLQLSGRSRGRAERPDGVDDERAERRAVADADGRRRRPVARWGGRRRYLNSRDPGIDQYGQRGRAGVIAVPACDES